MNVLNEQLFTSIFSLQACRGREELESSTSSQTTGTSGDKRNPDTTDQHSDVLIASSTIADFVAFRSTVDGSFFIRHLCQVFQDHAELETVQDMLLRVNDKVIIDCLTSTPVPPGLVNMRFFSSRFLITEDSTSPAPRSITPP